jgi:hypothetical protein
MDRESIKKFLPRDLFNFIRKIVYPEKIGLLENDLGCLFKTYYGKIAAADLNQKTAIRNAEFKVFSKHGGDGILLYIFSKIGVTNRTFAEIGVEAGRECNTANLSINFGWQGIIVDANERGIESAKIYYQGKKVKPVHCRVTAENINGLLLDNNIRGEIDLFSLDIDGNDYWVWKAIEAIRPRVIVAEYNASLGLRPITIKYKPDFRYQGDLYFGASLTVLAKLAKEKGYILIGCDRYGHDGFFVRKDAAEGKFIELSPQEAFYHNPDLIKKIGSPEKQFEWVKNRDFHYVQ